MATGNELVVDDMRRTAAADREAWQSVLELCGEQTHEFAENDQATDGLETQVAARSYTANQAARLLDIKLATLRLAATELALDSFVDPRGTLRFPVYSFAPTAEDPDLREMIAGYERLRPQDLRSILGISNGQLGQWLREAGILSKRIIWRDVRGLWGLPESFAEYRALLVERATEDRDGKTKKRRGRRSRRKRRDAEHRLRNRLIDAFPKWRYAYREQQQILLAYWRTE